MFRCSHLSHSEQPAWPWCPTGGLYSDRFSRPPRPDARGVVELDAIRVAALGNNAPVSFGALGAPIIALSAVTKVPLDQLSASVGRIVALLALLPPWILILLVTGRRGLRGAWPLAVVGSLSFILGQLPSSQFLGPYLPDIIGAVVCFGALLLLLRFWRPKETLGFGGVPVDPEKINSAERTRVLDLREVTEASRRRTPTR
jgi:lactate permease